MATAQRYIRCSYSASSATQRSAFYAEKQKEPSMDVYKESLLRRADLILTFYWKIAIFKMNFFPQMKNALMY